MDLISKLHSIMETKFRHLPGRDRPIYKDLSKKAKNAFIVTGPRGVGKTTFVLKHIEEKNILYFSADNPLLATTNLWALGEMCFQEGYDGIAIDEVHFFKDWSLHLKALYDAYPQKEFVASDSSSLVLRTGLGDLSRRFLQINIPLLSFREYIYLKEDILFSPIELFNYDKKEIEKISKLINIIKMFKEYIQGGLRPIFEEGNYQERLTNIIHKTIYADIPYFVPSIADNHLRLLNSVIGYLAISTIPRLKVRSLCSEWQIGAEKLYNLLNVMEHTGLIRIIRKQKDNKIHSVGEKIFFYDPSMYSLYESSKGNLREAFVAAMANDTGNSFFISKNEEVADFYWDKYNIEIGGKSKNIKKADYVIRDDIEFPFKKEIPLWLMGFLY